MTDRCKECGTPVDEVPFKDCAEHRRVHLLGDRQEWHDARVRDATTLDRLLGDLDRQLNTVSNPAQRIELRQLSSSAARLSYDLKAYLRAHKPRA